MREKVGVSNEEAVNGKECRRPLRSHKRGERVGSERVKVGCGIASCGVE